MDSTTSAVKWIPHSAGFHIAIVLNITNDHWRCVSRPRQANRGTHANSSFWVRVFFCVGKNEDGGAAAGGCVDAGWLRCLRPPAPSSSPAAPPRLTLGGASAERRGVGVGGAAGAAGGAAGGVGVGVGGVAP